MPIVGMGVFEDGVGGIKDYLDKTEDANSNVLAAMNNGEKVADGESITLDRVRGYIEVPNAWNQFRYYDFGFKLTFKADAVQSTAASVAFTNTYASGETPTPPAPGKETGSLSVSKTVAGDAGDKTLAFPFTVTLGDALVNGTFGGMTFIDGAATFALTHGETVTATGLPAGVRYTDWNSTQ